MSVGASNEYNIEWSSQLEDILAQEGERCRGLAWLHIRAEALTSKYNTFVQVPVIVMSTLAGTASVGSATLFGGGPASSIAIGLVSIGVGILNTLGSFFAFAKRTEAHRIAHLNYSKLSSKISIELSLPRDERMLAEPFLDNIREIMERLAETTPMVPEQILLEFNKKFKGDVDSDEGIALPVETNGLHKIKVYRAKTHTDTPLETPSSVSIRVV
jgi:hypothetical protein